MENNMNNNQTPETENENKITFKDRIKKIPVKKVCKTAGIIAGTLLAAVVIGKVKATDEPDIPDEDDDDDE